MKKFLKLLRVKKPISCKPYDVSEVRKLGIKNTYASGVIVVGGYKEDLVVGKIVGWVPKTITPIIKDYITGVVFACYGPMLVYSDEALGGILKLNATERVLLLNPKRIRTNLDIINSRQTKEEYLRTLRDTGFFKG